MSFPQILKSALQKGIRQGNHDWLVQPLQELDTRWLYWRFPVMVAEEAPFCLSLLRYHYAENAHDRQYLTMIYHSLADAPKNRDAAALASHAGTIDSTHPELVRFRQLISRCPKPEGVELKVLRQWLTEDMPPREESEDIAYCRHVMLDRLYQGGMPGDRFILLAALHLTLLRGVNPHVVLRDNLDDLRNLRPEVPTCALDMHNAEGQRVVDAVCSRYPDIPRRHVTDMWFACRSGLVNPRQAPQYVHASKQRLGTRESLWHPLGLRELAREMGQDTPGDMASFWTERLLPDVERESRKALDEALQAERDRKEQENRKPVQLKLF